MIFNGKKEFENVSIINLSFDDRELNCMNEMRWKHILELFFQLIVVEGFNTL